MPVLTKESHREGIRSHTPFCVLGDGIHRENPDIFCPCHSQLRGQFHDGTAVGTKINGRQLFQNPSICAAGINGLLSVEYDFVSRVLTVEVSVPKSNLQQVEDEDMLTLYLPMIHWGNKCYPIHLSTYWCPLVYMQR